MATKRKPSAPQAPPPEPASKLEQVIAALRSPAGATVPDLMDLTGWQEKSVRGFLSGALKKKRQLPVTSTKTDGVRTYRIAEPQA